MEAFATCASIALQYGVPLEDLCSKFSFMRFEPSGFTNNRDIPSASSIPDYLFRYLSNTFLKENGEMSKWWRGIHDAWRREGEENDEHVEEMYTRYATDPVSSVSPVDIPQETMSPATLPMQGDAPICAECGAITVRSGACYVCMKCGSSSGCG